jgi:hypothetical protein
MKIRLMGLPAEVDQAVMAIRDAQVFDVAQVDGPYPNRQRIQYEDKCPDCNVRPGGVHTPRCGARDSGQDIWDGSRPPSRLVRVYIEAQLRGHGRADP